MKKRRRSRRHRAEDVVWALVVGALAIGGIILCARYQGDLHGAGIRLALIAGAVCIGAAGGLLADRVTASRRSSRRSGPNRKTRRHIRTVTFTITGIVVASCILAYYLAHQLWIIISAAAAVLVATWLWYFVENSLLLRGVSPGRLHDDED